MANTYFVVYSDTTGELLRVGMCDETLVSAQEINAGETAVAVNAFYQPSEYYWHLVNDELTERPDFTATWDVTTITANGSSTATLETLPNPTTIVITVPVGVNSVADQNITDGSFEMTTNVTGVYTITATAFPYKTQSWEITAE